MERLEEQGERFDFEAYKRKWMGMYSEVRPTYQEFSRVLRAILEQCLKDKPIRYHSIEARAKSAESFGEKAAKPSDEDPSTPKYSDPLTQIRDLAGIRIIAFFPKTLEHVDRLLHEEMDVLEKSDKGDLLEQEEKLGYQSVHYLVKLKASRTDLPEYKAFRDMIAEIQVRTILQHTWAEIEHDIEYKSVITIPASIRRRFISLAGLLEIADREFQSIQDEDVKLREQARESVRTNRLQEVEITPDALKAYLDRKVGADGRMSSFSYSYEASMLIRMGFTDLKHVDECISGYNDDKISRLLYGTRQGQLTRFEDMLLAGMGENFAKRHPWADGEYGDHWKKTWSRRLEELRKCGVSIGKYDTEGRRES